MKKFLGNLESIAPSNLIKKEDVKDIDRFFLALGLIYNDLKDIILFDVLIRETYEFPSSKEPSVHVGEFSGVRLHIERLLIGLVSEFFTFLSKNQEIIKSYDFLLILKSLSTEDKKLWEGFMLVLDSSNNKEGFFSKIARIRGNVVFHYDHSGDELIKGFVDKFFEQEKDISNKRAYFSIGENMESSRFFYCDAVIEAYLIKHLNIKNEKNYQKELVEKISEMNLVVGHLIRKYLETKNK